MFTGIIEEIGKILAIQKNYIEIEAKHILDDVTVGDSISVNGVCLTVAKNTSDSFIADISPVTKSITTLKYLSTGSFVNLERAMPIKGRFGGHIVSGHIDGIGKILKIVQQGEFYELFIELNEECSSYIAKKGSIAINGISLTIADINKNVVKIAIIPHTYENTVLKFLKIGDYVNIETDILAKYIEKFLSMRDNRTRIDMAFLQENGF